jgi:hypothetical protein
MDVSNVLSWNRPYPKEVGGIDRSIKEVGGIDRSIDQRIARPGCLLSGWRASEGIPVSVEHAERSI